MTTNPASPPPSTSTLPPLPLPKNPAELQSILMMVMAGDNTNIQRATAVMKAFLKTSDAVAPMMQQIQSSTVTEARQMAAVLLRERIKALWKNLPNPVKEDVKKALLQRLVVETSRPVRLALAALVSSLAKQLVPEHKWNELLDFLLQCSKSEQSAHREVAMMLFRALAENIPTALKPHFRTLQQIFQRGLADPDEKVRVEALRAIGEMVQMVDNDKALTSFYEVIPPMVILAKQHIVAQDEDIIISVFEVFEILASSPLPVLDQHIPHIIQLMLEVVINATLDIGIREKACAFIVALVEAKPMKVVKSKLVEAIHKCSIALMIEPHDDSEDEPTDMTPQRIGVDMLDSLLSNVPHKHVYEPTIQTALTLIQSANPSERKGGLVVLSTMTEGCGEELRLKLDQLVPMVCTLLQDREHIVRAAAAMTLIQFGDDLQPEINKYHKDIFPHIFNILDSNESHIVIVERACDALLVFCEHMDSDDILQYLDISMKKLSTMVKSSHLVVQESSVGAIKSIALAAGDKFLPYFQGTIQTMAPLMQLTGDDHLKLRCRATECVGAIAQAVGKQHFAPYLQDCVKVVVAGMALDYFELREASYNFFGTLANMLEQDFNSLLPTVITFALATCQSDDGVMVSKTGGDLDGGEDYGINSDEEEDEDDLEAEMRHLNLSIRSGALDEKVAALACITNVIHATQAAFLPFLEKTIKELDELSEYPHHFIRHGTINVYAEIFKLLHLTFPNPRQWTKGENVKLHENTRKVVDQILPVLIARLTEEEDRDTCANACDCLAELCKTFGLGAIQAKMQDIFKGLMKLVQEKAPCQRPTDDQDEKEERDHDEILIDSVTDLISAIAAICGPSFEPAFKQLLPPLLKFNAEHRAPFDRSMAIGCIGEVVQELGNAVGPYLPKLTPIILNALRDPVIYVRRNAAFATGNLCATGCDYIKKHYSQVLQALQPTLMTEEEAQHISEQKRKQDPMSEDKFINTEFLACRDNALSAIAKMIVTAPQSVPLEQVVPVFLKFLPLREDQLEAKHVYPCIIHLYKTHANIIGPHTPTVISIFSQVFGNPDIDTALQREWIAFCQQLLQQLGPQAEPLLQSVPAAQRETFLKYLNAAASASASAAAHAANGINGTASPPASSPR